MSDVCKLKNKTPFSIGNDAEIHISDTCDKKLTKISFTNIYLQMYKNNNSCLISGVNRHFEMIFIHEKLNGSANKKISSKQIWQHLSTLYDLQALVCSIHVLSLEFIFKLRR